MKVLCKGATVLITSILLLPSCEKNDIAEEKVPYCIKKKIRRCQADNNYCGIKSVAIWEIKNGETYYYTVSAWVDACDALYDNNCKMICAPTGCFGGGGDGQCPNFGQIEKTIIWQDKD